MTRILFASLLAGIGLHASAQSLQDAIRMTDREQYEAATAIFRSLLAASPNDGQAWFFMGENYWYNDQTDSAAACYSTGARLNPMFPLNHAGLGKLQMAAGNRGGADALFQTAIATATAKTNKFPKSLQAMTYREVAEGLGSGPNADIPAALIQLDKAIELDPNDAESFVLRGDLLVDRGSFDASDAIAAYKKAAELLPSAARPVAKKALMYYRAKNYEAAVTEFDHAVTIDPSFAPAYSGRAEAHFMTKAYDKATADYNQYLALNKGSTSARVRYAKFLYLTGKYAESLEEIAKLRGSGVMDNQLKRIEGYCLTETGDFTNALARMQEYFAAQPAEKVISTDYEVMGRIYSGMAKDAPIPPQPPVPPVPPMQAPETSIVLPAQGPNLDSLAAENYLTAARMDRNKQNLFIEAGKSFSKAKLHAQAAAAFHEKIMLGRPEVNDYYYLGGAAYKAGLYPMSDSAWTVYVERQPSIHQGYLGRARANAGIDSTKTTWQARPFYEEVVRKIKPDEQAKYKVELEEAYFYLGFYYFSSANDKGSAKCWFEKLAALNAGTSNTKTGMDMLLNLKDVAAKDCALPMQ
ncbi:MAG: tetratricopeptide repeat protein [Flavobacteriales bacterium]